MAEEDFYDPGNPGPHPAIYGLAVSTGRVRVIRVFRTRHNNFIREAAYNWKALEPEARKAIVIQGGSFDFQHVYMCPLLVAKEARWRKGQDWIRIADAVSILAEAGSALEFSSIARYINAVILDTLVNPSKPLGHGRRLVRESQILRLARK